MFRSLYSKLAVTLFVLLLLVGLVLMQLVRHSSEMYQQEVAQKLNTELARHMVSEQPLLDGSRVNRDSLEHLFHLLMVINPSIELYLLDSSGRILAYSAPEGKVKLDRVDMQAVQEFMQGNRRYPLQGDDPRSLTRKKVFSVAPVSSDGAVQGYLYIVLGSEQYDDVVQMLQTSYILKASGIILLVALCVALFLGLIVFSWQTRRLKTLARIMSRFTDESVGRRSPARYPGKDAGGDEIEQLGRQFNHMADTINHQFQEMEKMDSMRRDLVANVSHDLRTPLTSMQGYLETLQIKDETLSAQERQKYLRTALSHSQRLNDLVSELFELARLDSCETVIYSEPFSMGELVQDVSQQFQLRAEQKSIQLRTELSPHAPLVYGDIGMMQRVLENLLENGLRHTPEGGCITIAVAIETGSLLVRVTDTGTGIPEEELPRIFDRFHTLDKQRSVNAGSGLGLAIARRIIELHGGSISVDTRLNEGTTFSFCMSTSASA